MTHSELRFHSDLHVFTVVLEYLQTFIELGALSCGFRSKLKTLRKKRRRIMNEEELAEVTSLPNSLVVLEKAISDVTSELGHPDFQDIEGGRCVKTSLV